MSKAAHQLCVSQPAISEVIADLEQALAVRLFDRLPHGVEPTVYGRALARRSIAALDELRLGVRDIASLADPTSGEVRIGCTEPMTAVLLPILERYTAEHPGLLFHIDSVDPGTLDLQRLHDRRFDFVLGLSPLRSRDGDWDGDLDVDIITANEASNNLSIFFNDGTGQFPSKRNQSLGTGVGPRALVVGMLNAGSSLDIAVANRSSNSVTVLYNTLFGYAFSLSQVSLGGALEPRSIATGDLDGDGDLDLATANYGSSNVSLLRNDGSSFSFVANRSLFGRGASVVIAELSTEGLPDIAIATQGTTASSDTVTVLRNLGSWTFPVLPQVYPFPAGSQPSTKPSVATSASRCRTCSAPSSTTSRSAPSVTCRRRPTVRRSGIASCGGPRATSLLWPT
jgi:hypothetical protein